MAKGVSLAPLDVRNRQTELVGHFDPEIILDTPDFGFPVAQIVGSAGVSVATDLTQEYAGQLETMEFYSVARSWRTRVQSLVGIFYVTNNTGPNARKEWNTTFRDAAQITSSRLIPIIQSKYYKASN
jgi:hypothetical protein